MAGDRNESTESRASAGDDGTPRGPEKRLRLPLKSIDDCKLELARLYRDGKAGRRSIADVSRLANVLGILGRLIEGVDLEQRLEALQEKLEERSR